MGCIEMKLIRELLQENISLIETWDVLKCIYGIKCFGVGIV